jgi:hypothetical protein
MGNKEEESMKRVTGHASFNEQESQCSDLDNFLAKEFLP